MIQINVDGESMSFGKRYYILTIILICCLIAGCSGKKNQSGNEGDAPLDSTMSTQAPTMRPTVESFLDLPPINGATANGLEVVGVIEQKATNICFSPDGRLVAVGTWDEGIYIYDVVKMKQIQNLPNRSYVAGMVFSFDGRFFVAAVNTPISSDVANTTVYVWKTSDWSMLADGDYELGAGTGKSMDQVDIYQGFLNYAPNGNIILTSGHISSLKSGKIIILRVDGNSLNKILEIDVQPNNALWGSILMPDGQKILSGDRLYDMSSGTAGEPIEFSENSTTTAAISPDGNSLAYASLGSKIVHIATTGDFKNTKNMYGFDNKILSIDFSPDGSLVAGSSQDHVVKVWRLYDEVELATLTGTYDVTFSPKGNLLAAIQADLLGNDHKVWAVMLFGVISPGKVTPIPTVAPTATLPEPTIPPTPPTPTNTATIVIPTIDPNLVTPTPAPMNYWDPCPGTYSSHLSVGIGAYVVPGYGSNRVRSSPSRSGEVIGSLPELSYLSILEGPICADGWIWWKVASDASPTGWTSEGELGIYWLMPQ